MLGVIDVALRVVQEAVRAAQEGVRVAGKGRLLLEQVHAPRSNGALARLKRLKLWLCSKVLERGGGQGAREEGGRRAGHQAPAG